MSGGRYVSNSNTAKPMQPRERPLDNRAVPAKPVARFRVVRCGARSIGLGRPACSEGSRTPCRRAAGATIINPRRVALAPIRLLSVSNKE